MYMYINYRCIIQILLLDLNYMMYVCTYMIDFMFYSLLLLLMYMYHDVFFFFIC